MTVTYQVGGGGHLDIDFWVSAVLNGIETRFNVSFSLQTRTTRLLQNKSDNPRELLLSRLKWMDAMSTASQTP